MADALAAIFAARAKHRDAQMQAESYEIVAKRARASVRERRDFLRALQDAPGVAIVAEVKRASPSAGLIAKDFDHRSVARTYERAGADAISVLTEPDHFLGDLSYLADVRGVTSLPLLRKDFLSTRYDIAQAAAYGADCVLLIVASLDDDSLRECMDEAGTYALSVLVEVHDRLELERALRLDAKLIGINNRNLRTMTTDLAVSEDLLPHIPRSVFALSESGMRDERDVERVMHAGARGVLIGESLMRSSDPARAIAATKRLCTQK